MEPNINLFPGRRDRMGHNGPFATFSGGNIRALKLEGGGYELETSGISISDARVFAKGELKPAEKRSPQSPDFRGYLDEPDERGTEKPGRYEVAAWLKPIQRGERAGQMYLSLSLKKVAVPA